MKLIVANTRIKSIVGKAIYANEMDILKLIEMRGHVALYYNLHTKQRFPSTPDKTKTIDSRLYIKPTEEIKSTKQKKPTNQLSLF